jgi:hypothetical protein
MYHRACGLNLLVLCFFKEKHRYARSFLSPQTLLTENVLVGPQTPISAIFFLDLKIEPQIVHKSLQITYPSITTTFKCRLLRSLAANLMFPEAVFRMSK